MSCWRWGEVPCRIRVVMFCVCCVLQKQEMGVMLEMG